MSTVEGGFRLNIVKPDVWARLDAKFTVFLLISSFPLEFKKFPFTNSSSQKSLSYKMFHFCKQQQYLLFCLVEMGF